MSNDQKKISLFLLIALVGFPQISETIYTPALPSIETGLNVSAYLVEATLAIYFLGFSVGVFLWGTISDFIGRRYVMLIGLLLYGMATFNCAIANTIESLLIWRFLQAFGASVGSVITQTIVRDAYDASDRISLFSKISAALAFSPAIGPLLGGVISEYLDWRANFWILVALSFVLFIWTFVSLQETKPKHTKNLSVASLKELFLLMLSSRQLFGHVLLISCTNGIIFGFYQEAPFVFIKQLGMQPSWYGCFGLLIASATILAAKISYKQRCNVKYESIIYVGSMYVSMGGCVLTLLAVFSQIPIYLGLFVVVLTLFIIFFGIGLIIPNSLSHALKIYSNQAGAAGSIFGGLYYCLIAGFMWLMSIIHNGTVFPLPLYITLLSTGLLLGTRMIRQSHLFN